MIHTIYIRRHCHPTLTSKLITVCYYSLRNFYLTYFPGFLGPTNKKLRLHLPIVVSDDNTDPHSSAWLQVDGQKLILQEGKCVIFDDSFIHDSTNLSKHPRVVLIIDIWHPDLSNEEVSYIVSTTYCIWYLLSYCRLSFWISSIRVRSMQLGGCLKRLTLLMLMELTSFVLL